HRNEDRGALHPRHRCSWVRDHPTAPLGAGSRARARHTDDQRTSPGARAPRTTRVRLWEPAPEPVRGTPTTNGHHRDGALGDDVDAVVDARRAEADAFYATVIPSNLEADQTSVVRQALAGMLWSKQHYFYDVDRWLEEHGSAPFSSQR